MSCVEELAGNRLTEAQVIFATKFEHTVHRVLSGRLSSNVGFLSSNAGCMFNDGEEVLFQRHAAGLGAGEETSFDFGF